jgi:hypothetical protein
VFQVSLDIVEWLAQNFGFSASCLAFSSLRYLGKAHLSFDLRGAPPAQPSNKGDEAQQPFLRLLTIAPRRLGRPS